jgi:hypothetical protein
MAAAGAETPYSAGVKTAMEEARSGRRRRWRYIILVVLIAAVFGGWTLLWRYAADQAQAAIDGWRAREARAGRVFNCGSQSIGGYPFRIEVECLPVSAEFRSEQPPFEIRTNRVLVAVQLYQPNLLISEISGPLTIADLGGSPKIVADWKLGQSSVRGIPSSPERVSFVFDKPVVELVDGGTPLPLLRADHVEVHGRIAEGSAAENPVIEIALQLVKASAPSFHPAAVPPVDADITGVMRGLGDFSPKPWDERFRELQRRGGRIDITQARVQQGDTLAIGSGSLAIDPNGRLTGEMDVTVAGLEPFLKAIGASEMVQRSPNMDKLAGMLDRLSPGLGDIAREQAGANISTGINMLGRPTELEGRQAVTLPLRLKDGTIYLGPIPIGPTPVLF